jgi:prevent-host-death family protein
MTYVSIKEARATIGRLIDKAEQGEEIIVTRNGRKVAVIHGLPSQRQRLLALGNFRKKIKVSGSPASCVVMKNRSNERF